jgi:hypothetical protein
MKPTHIVFDVKVGCIEAPDKPIKWNYESGGNEQGAYVDPTYYEHLKIYEEALEQAMKEIVYFDGLQKPYIMDLLRGGNTDVKIIQGKLYPVPDGFEIVIKEDPDNRDGKLYAILVPKQDSEYHPIGEDGNVRYTKQPTSIEEAMLQRAYEYFAKDEATIIGGFIAGAKHQSENNLSDKYLNKIKEVCEAVDGNLLVMPAAIQAIQALINEYKQESK